MSNSLIAVDIGNTRIKLGRFVGTGARLPQPVAVLEFDPSSQPLAATIGAWLAEFDEGALRWAIASVNRPAGEEFLAWLEEHRAGEAHRVLAYRDLDLRIDLPAPERVGIDRLLAALAVNRLRETDRPAVIADLGTAIKVDAVSAGGAFLGGAILPGIRMSARALQQQTDLLPDIELVRLEQAPEAVGKSTNAAIHSGLFWGAVGAIRELVARYTEQFGTEPLVVLAGGAAPAVARLLRQDAIYEPHLVLSGIAISALAEPGAV